MKFEQTHELVMEWGEQKGILPNPDRRAQWSKTLEEVTELFKAIMEDDEAEAMDAVGDIMVTLAMQTGAWNFTLEEAYESAYHVISKRTGKMVGGQFVKDGK